MDIRCPTCLLRPLVPADAESLARHANDREVWRNLRDAFPHPYSVEDARGYIAMSAGRTPQTSFGIVVDGEAAGGVSLRPGADVERASAEIGYWLGRAFRGRGVVTDAVRAATRYAFATLGMHRVWAVPFEHNAASCRVLEKAGYVLEGRMRRSAIKEGVVMDQWLWAAYDDMEAFRG
jgi:[ribosomal protein S5]-alanine N-acetyltransferase